MTISSTPRIAGPFTGTGVLVPYPFSFKVFQTSDLLITTTNSGGLITTLALSTDYTVALNADQDVSPGGTINLIAALPVGSTMIATSNIPATQPASLSNLGAFFPKVIEAALDRLTILFQQLGYVGITQALRVPEIAGVTAFPDAATRANTTVGFDSAGNPTVLTPVSGSASDVLTRLADTANAAKGPALVGYNPNLVYAHDTVGKKLQEVRSAYDYGARGVSNVVDTAAINAGIADLHTNFGGGILKLNAFIDTAIELTSLTNQTDVVLYDERYRTTGHVSWFNTGGDVEIRAHGASTASGEGPSFVVQNNATSGNRTGSFVARYGSMTASNKVNSYFHFGVWDGAAWTPDLDWLGNGDFGGTDDFRSRLRVGAAGSAILNPAGAGRNIDAAAAKADGYTFIVNRPTPPGGGALQYQFGVKDGAVECPQEVQIYAASAAVRFQNASQANKWSLVSEFPSAGQFTVYDHAATASKMIFNTGGATQVIGGFTLIAQTAASAANDTLFLDTADGKLKFKDAGGVVNALY